MPAPPIEQVTALNATMPCYIRRLALQLDNTIAGTYGWFPWKGQRIDTPVGVTTPWTSDDDTHPRT